MKPKKNNTIDVPKKRDKTKKRMLNKLIEKEAAREIREATKT